MTSKEKEATPLLVNDLKPARQKILSARVRDDVDVVVTLLKFDNASVLAVQDVIVSTGDISRGWYVTLDERGREAAGEIANSILELLSKT